MSNLYKSTLFIIKMSTSPSRRVGGASNRVGGEAFLKSFEKRQKELATVPAIKSSVKPEDTSLQVIAAFPPEAEVPQFDGTINALLLGNDKFRLLKVSDLAIKWHRSHPLWNNELLQSFAEDATLTKIENNYSKEIGFPVSHSKQNWKELLLAPDEYVKVGTIFDSTYAQFLGLPPKDTILIGFDNKM